MLTKETIQIDAKPKGLSASEFIIRQVSREDKDDTGWRFQAVVRNDASSALTALEYAIRYYDSGGRFVGLDEGFTLGSDDIGRNEDKSISIDLDIPASANRAIFSIKARKTSLLEKYNLLIFGILIVVAAILFLFSDLLK